MLGRGLNIEEYTDKLDICINNMGASKNDIFLSWGVMLEANGSESGVISYVDEEGVETEITKKEAFLEYMHAVSAFSPVFKGCYEDMDNGFYRLYMFFSHYQSMRNYMLNLVANMLSYALFFNSWSERIQYLESEPGNELELLYVYAVIIRKLFQE